MAVTEAARAPSDLVLKRIEPADAESTVALSDEAGWNQTVEDWRFMVGQGRAMGLRDRKGTWVASSLILPQAPGLSWISMVLVTRAHRRSGLGTMLLRRCIGAVQEEGGVPGLDATELGRPVYLPLGFQDVYTISRWRIDAQRSEMPAPPGCTIRPMRESDLEAVIAFDVARSATSRGHILRYLFGLVRNRACLAERDGQIVGYALGRPGQKTPQVGPVIADHPDVGIALVARMLTGPAILDVPNAQRDLAGWLREAGAVRERGFTRMTLGRFPGLEDASRIYALAGPELG
jgi:GNAT superfamily N-acetyltransferase